MNTWDEITATAVIGTSQQELLIPAGDDDLNRVLQQLKGPNPEQVLLTSVSVVALYKQAGLELLVDVLPRPVPCEIEEKVRGTITSGQHLSLMLEGEFRELLPEWLVAMTNAGKRVPEEYLPTLLDHARDDQQLRQLILPVIGKRGEWLATENSDWSYVHTQGQEVWETSTRDERLRLLERLRAKDPRQARQMLASTWQQEPARDRAAFLEKLLVNLSEEDEEFLAEALNDRSGEVRRAARTILAGLPQSRFSRRVGEVLSEVMTFKKPLLGKARIEVALPDEPFEWIKAKGIEIDTPPRTRLAQSMGPKGWTLKELVALSDLSFLQELWQESPSRIVGAASESEWASGLLEGLIQAARRDRNADWIEALITNSIQQPEQSATASWIADLASHLPPVRLETLATSLVKQSSTGLNDQNPALVLLLAHRHAWSDSLSRLVINSIKTRIRNTQKSDANDWGTRSALKQFARYLPPELHDELVAEWPVEADAWSSWAKSVDALRALLSFRRDMYRAVTSDN
jgi:hypothetical protein